MRFSFLCGVALLGTLAACTRAPYAVLPTTPAYHATATRPASPAPPTPAPAAPATVTSTAQPILVSKTNRLPLGRRLAPVRHKLKLRPGFPAPLRQVTFHPLQARRSNALSVQSSSSTNSVVAAALGLIAAVIGGLLFFLSVVYGASAGLILVWLLLIIGGIFLAFRHLRNK